MPESRVRQRVEHSHLTISPVRVGLRAAGVGRADEMLALSIDLFIDLL